MNILSVNTADIGGGAERVGWALFNAFRSCGHRSKLVVGTKRSNDPDVIALPSRRSVPRWISHPLWAMYSRFAQYDRALPGSNTIRTILRTAAGGWGQYAYDRGLEDFHFPASRRLLHNIEPAPDIVQAHNLHGNYFDLRVLEALSHQHPIILTLHDEWLLTGHCAYTLGCNRWQHGCGCCPHLDVYPPLAMDGTASNWKRKRDIYAHSRLYVVTPSQWLMRQLQGSMLMPLCGRVIPNGVDLTIYKPGDRLHARLRLGIPADAVVLLFAANGTSSNSYKDFSTLRNAVNLLANLDEHHLIFMALGSIVEHCEQIGAAEMRHIAYVADPVAVSRYYQAADIFLHAARADTFPNTVLEAQACGIPVVATAVGGISEQLDDGVSGYLVAAGDSEAIAARARQLVNDPALRERMGCAAAERARANYDLNNQVATYLSWYSEILAQSR